LFLKMDKPCRYRRNLAAPGAPRSSKSGKSLPL
jgi:hypothetical protein